MSSEPVVETTSGKVRGRDLGQVGAFTGIPYAASPVGQRRLAPPVPHEGWTGVRAAEVPGPAVPQNASRLEAVMGPRTPDWDEDGCLNLNVWAPAGARDLPVLVWFHGGGFSSGSGGWDWYDGARLAELGGIVVVTANYRLGPLGYLHLPELGADNLGLRDQAAVLHWVHENIAAFGGNPGLLTVGGQSAGAYSSLLLAMEERTRPLSSRVILQSGPLALSPMDPELATERATRYLEILGTDAAGLRAEPVTGLLAAAAELAAETARPGEVAPALYPVLGGFGAARALPDALAEDPLAGLDVLVGTVHDELTAFGIREPGVTAAGLGAAGPDALTEHRTGRTYVYRFDRVPDPDPGALGATHCAELPFLFGTFEAYPDAAMLGPVTEADHALHKELAGAVAEFVATGRAPWPEPVRHFG
ncbi:carboxylesterase family protein [Sciscionella sediminilitoris]|uniref:carboxylesterase family protein n=1 Tax=Sciscionella sediminilitoris TaxID=1445613 RepID=UPI0004DF62AF|nr:carboxylesterase family protein [Sciscionella sp. SE31]